MGIELRERLEELNWRTMPPPIENRGHRSNSPIPVRGTNKKKRKKTAFRAIYEPLTGGSYDGKDGNG
jgi:hypothetical protein